MRPHGHVLVIEPIVTSEAQRVFNLFEDETDVLAQAQAAIASGPLEFVVQRQIDAIWELPHAEALFVYPFHPDIADPLRKEQVLRAHLGARLDACPIRLRDTLMYTLCSSPQRLIRKSFRCGDPGA